MSSSIFMDGIRMFFSMIDRAVYGLVSTMYELLLKLSEITVFSNNDIQDFSTRVYTFLGIIMLFKVTFSLISYLVNPDSLSDKTNGAGNLIKNIIITLFLVITVPFAFDLLYRVQNAILKDNLISRFILGTNGETTEELSINMNPELCGENTSDPDDVGDYLSLVAMRPFFQPYNNDKLKEDLKKDGTDEKKILDKYCMVDNIDSLMISEIYNADSSYWFGEYYFDYKLFLSTAVGVFILLLLISFCFDVAVRSIKLGFLEIIAPIPIISYIDPKSSKSGMFKKWTDEVIKTWAGLFTRLAAIFFAIYAIQVIGTSIDEGLFEHGIWINLFLIIGALMFAKQVPKLLEDLFGIKMAGSMQLNPFKKISDEALGGKQLVSMPGKLAATGIGGAVSLAGSISSNLKKRNDFKKKKDAALEARQKMHVAMENRNQAQAVLDRANRIMANGRQTPSSQKYIAQYKAKAQATEKEYQAAKLDAKSKIEDAQKMKKENSELFSYNHPVLSAVTQTLRGGKIAFNEKDTANIVKAVQKGVEAAINAQKVKNNHDKFSFDDRLLDLWTDISGIKNSSGTTSLAKEQIKTIDERLADIRNAIQSVNFTMNNLEPGSITFDSDGNRMVNVNHTFLTPDAKKQTEELVGTYNMLRKSEKDYTKSRKEWQDTIDKKDKK